MGPSTPIRVLQLAESPYFGGITSHVLAIAEAFRGDERIHITAATLPGRREDNSLVDLGRARGIEVHEIPMAGTFDVRVIRTLKRFIAEQHIDLVHTHNYRATLLCALAAWNIPVVNTCHGMKVAPSPRLRAWQWAELRAMKRHRLTIACSDFVRQWLLTQGLAPEKVRTVHNGYAPPPEGPPAFTRTTLGIPEEAFVVLYMGRLVIGKGLKDLLEAVSKLPNAVVILTGEGPLRATLETHARELEAHAKFLGQVDQPGNVYYIADVVALPSEMEAFPMSLIEAAAYGKPVVASRVGGIPEIVHDGETGILVNAGDVSALHAALEQLMDLELRAGMGSNAKRRWQENFSIERMRQGLTEAYELAVKT